MTSSSGCARLISRDWVAYSGENIGRCTRDRISLVVVVMSLRCVVEDLRHVRYSRLPANTLRHILPKEENPTHKSHILSSGILGMGNGIGDLGSSERERRCG